MKISFYITSILLLLIAACGTHKTEKEKSLAEPSNKEKPTSSLADTTLNGLSDKIVEDKIIDTLMTLPFVKKTNDYLDSLTGHKRGIAFIIDSVADNEISVMAGYNGPERFETYYNFTIYRRTFDIMIADPESGELFSIAQYLKTKKER